jgi:hypothetical protein
MRSKGVADGKYTLRISDNVVTASHSCPIALCALIVLAISAIATSLQIREDVEHQSGTLSLQPHYAREVLHQPLPPLSTLLLSYHPPLLYKKLPTSFLGPTDIFPSVVLEHNVNEFTWVFDKIALHVSSLPSSLQPLVELNKQFLHSFYSNGERLSTYV